MQDETHGHTECLAGRIPKILDIQREFKRLKRGNLVSRKSPAGLEFELDRFLSPYGRSSDRYARTAILVKLPEYLTGRGKRWLFKVL